MHLATFYFPKQAISETGKTALFQANVKPHCPQVAQGGTTNAAVARFIQSTLEPFDYQ